MSELNWTAVRIKSESLSDLPRNTHQEADETQLWLELLRDDCGIRDDALDRLHQETDELLAIFTAMMSKLRHRP